MPMISDGSGDMASQLIQLIAMNRQRAMQQGGNLINTADAGATVGQVGMSPKQFAALFGKDTPFSADRVLRPESSSDVIDHQTRDWLKSLDPLSMANVIATNMSNRSGVAGSTTMEGLASDRKTNTQKSKAAEISSGTQVVTAQNVAQMVEEGLNAFKNANPKTREAVGQQASLGTTQDEAEAQRLKHQLGASALREALDAQTNPNAPIHEFLARNNLNLPTVLAATALGIENLLQTEAQIRFASRGAGFDINAAMEKAEIEHASQLSKDVFHGTLTPRQVRALMQNQEEGKAPPRGMEAATDLYGRSVSAYYNSAISEQLTKQDPYLQSIAQQIQALQKPGVDPNTLVAVQDLSSRAAGYAATLQQIGPQPDDPKQAAQWQEVLLGNIKRVPKGGIHFPLFSIGSSSQPGGLGAEGSNPQTQANILARPGTTPAPVAPVAPIPGIPPVSGLPSGMGGLLAPAGQPPVTPATPTLQLDKSQQDALTNYLKSIGVQQ